MSGQKDLFVSTSRLQQPDGFAAGSGDETAVRRESGAMDRGTMPTDRPQQLASACFPYFHGPIPASCENPLAIIREGRTHLTVVTLEWQRLRGRRSVPNLRRSIHA